MRRAARGPLQGDRPPVGTLGVRVPVTGSIYRRCGVLQGLFGTRLRQVPAILRRSAPAWSGSASVLRAAEALHRLGHAGGLVENLREANDGDGVLRGDLPPVDLLQEVDQFLVAAELRIVVLD